MSRRNLHTRRHAGLSLIELLIAMVITGMLLTATMAATHASFRAYAFAAADASAQTAARMIVNRVLGMIRTSTAQGPLAPDAGANPPVTLSGDTLSSNFIELIDSSNNLVRIEWRANTQELWMLVTPPAGVQTSQPLIGGVTNAVFSLTRRQDDEGLWILDRGTIDMTFVAGDDTTLALEVGSVRTIRIIASTMPRKLQ